MSYSIMVNGKFYSSRQACLPVEDRGFLFGDGLFETMRTYNGRVFGIERHIKRLFSSLHALDYNISFNPGKLTDLIGASINKNGLQSGQGYVKVIVTRGMHKGKISFSQTTSPNIIIIAKELKPYPQDLYRQGARIIRSSIVRPSFSNPAYRHKLLNYFESTYAKNEAEKKDALEAIFLTRDRMVLEGATSNIFIVKGKRIYTPPLTYNLLPGITREIVLDICRQNNMPAREKKFDFFELMRSDEVFVTNSLMEVMPVTFIESSPVSNARTGPLTRQLMALYRNMVSS
ncbi:MAG: aminotransferase class IV [Actinomycetia bacterium]|nr:aminotransferase class IV [Actinomycetes bacterium]